MHLTWGETKHEEVQAGFICDFWGVAINITKIKLFDVPYEAETSEEKKLPFPEEQGESAKNLLQNFQVF